MYHVEETIGVRYMEAGTIIRKSKEYIEKHIDEVLTVAKIAGTVGYSEYHFS